MTPRLLPVPIFHIDTNRINSRGNLPDMNRMEEWFHDGVIIINMSGTSFKEALAGNDSVRTKKTHRQIFTVTDDLIETDDLLYQKVEAAIFPSGVKDNNSRNDVRIVYEAAHYQAILITKDGGSRNQPGGILGNRDKLAEYVRIMTDAEAVQFVRQKIEIRDQFARQEAEASARPLPDWVGKD